MEIFITVWVSCSVFVYGLVFGTLQASFPVIAKEELWADFCFSLAVSVAGPIGFAAFVAHVAMSSTLDVVRFKWLPR